jgi:hypothetical protein
MYEIALLCMIGPFQSLIHLKLVSGDTLNEATDFSQYNLSQRSELILGGCGVSVFTRHAQPHGSSQSLIVGLAFSLFYSGGRVQQKIREPNWL